jgi:hypothetical protein
LARTRLRANSQVINSCYISVIPKLSSSPEGGRTVTRLVGRAEGRFGSTIAVFFHSWFDRCKGQRDRLLSTGSNPANAGEGRPHGSDPPGTHPAPVWAPPGNIFRILLNIFRSRATRRALPPARGNSDRTGVRRCAGLRGPNRSFLGGPARGVNCISRVLEPHFRRDRVRVKYGVTLRLSGYPLYTFDYNYYFKFFVSTGIYRRHENYPHTRRCFDDDCH